MSGRKMAQDCICGMWLSEANRFIVSLCNHYINFQEQLIYRERVPNPIQLHGPQENGIMKEDYEISGDFPRELAPGLWVLGNYFFDLYLVKGSQAPSKKLRPNIDANS